MDNYPYIIAGLPDFVLDYDFHQFDYDEVRNHIYTFCSPNDQRLIEWIEFGFEQKNLTNHFYRASLSNKNSFIRNFFQFDKHVRNAKVAYLKGTPYEEEFEEYVKIWNIFTVQNIIERERNLDKLIWNKVSDLVTYDFFNINVLLSFLVKAKMIQRWNKIDKKVGAELFEKYVKEVRGTYKGVEYNADIKKK